jgi:hypothetical protein
MSDIDDGEERKRKEDERAAWERVRADAKAEIEAARGDRDALAQAEAMLEAIEAKIKEEALVDRFEAEHAASDDDVWVSGKKPPPAKTILRWHAGLLKPAGFAAAVAALIGIGLWMRGGAGAGASPLLYVAAGFVAIWAAAYGQTNSCPRCGGWWARRVVAKAYSHTATRTSSEPIPSGGYRTATTTRDVHRAELVCLRCRLRWLDYI